MQQGVTNEKITNAIIGAGVSIASNMLFCAGMKNNFSNPFINAAQSFLMFSGDVNWTDTNIKTQLTLPLLNTAAVAVDDFLIDRGFTSEHYITDITTALAVGNNIAKSFTALGTISKKYNFESTPFVIPFAAGLYGLKKLMGGDNIISFLRGSMKVMKHLEAINRIDEAAVSVEGITLMNSIVENAFSDRTLECIPVIDKGLTPIIVGYGGMIKNLIVAICNSIYANNIAENISDVMSNRYKDITQNPEYLLRVASNEKENQTFRDFQKISNESFNGISGLINTCGSLLSATSKTSLSPSVFYGVNILNTLGISNDIGKQLFEVEDELSINIAKADQTTQSLLSQPRTIIERAGIPYYNNISNNVTIRLDELNSLKLDLQGKQSAKTLGDILIGFATGVIANQAVGEVLTKMQANENPANDIENIVKSITNFTSTLNAHLQLNTFNSMLPCLDKSLISTMKIVDLFNYVDNVKNTSYVHYYSHNNTEGLDMRDISIVINGSDKLNIDEMFLECGRKYLITGKTGCGKTTLMSTLRGLPNFAPAIEIDGSISYPKAIGQAKPLVFELTQNDNFPYCVKIIEAILYPMITTEVEHEKFAPLVRQIMIEMEGFADDSSAAAKEYLEFGLLSRLFEFEGDIYTATSGGQKKKMALTGLLVNIMHQSGMFDIYAKNLANGMSFDAAIANARNSVGSVLVLLDEVYNGLDNDSKRCVMDVVAKYLPSKAIVVSVEHQPQYEKYDYRLHLNGDTTYNFTHANGAPANISGNASKYHNPNYHPDMSRGAEHDNDADIDPMEFAPLNDSKPCVIFEIEG